MINPKAHILKCIKEQLPNDNMFYMMDDEVLYSPDNNIIIYFEDNNDGNIVIAKLSNYSLGTIISDSNTISLYDKNFLDKIIDFINGIYNSGKKY